MQKQKPYDHKKIESKLQKEWDKKKLYEVKNGKKGKTFYGLVEFPFPSGAGLHTGHVRSYVAMDIISRKRRMQGYNVLYPMGWDAFGLPTENYAIKTGMQPEKVTKQNTDVFRRQLKALGLSFDWSREVNTTDPAYFKWTQWIFLEMYKKGLAYKAKTTINWCPKDKIGLANEEVVDGKCERCGTQTEKREKEQWMLAITKYADRLDKDLDTVEYLEKIKIQQRNWIGKSEGAEVVFPLTYPGMHTSKRILIGTRNEAKFRMIKECMPTIPGVEFVNLNDIDQVDDSDLVEGGDFAENARMKAKFYFEKTGIPTISTDNIFWVEKWPKNKGIIVHMRKEANPKSERATDDEVVTYFNTWIKKNGSSKAHFIFGLAYADHNGVSFVESTQREYILQNKVVKAYPKGYPLEHFLRDAQTGEYKCEQSDVVRYDRLISVLKEKAQEWFAPINQIKVFTTRIDTIFSGTFLVVAPEHQIIKNLELKIKNWEEVKTYLASVKNKPDIERTAESNKTGVELKGIEATNPATGEKMPVWVSDFVLGSYGTGAVFADAHDKRDFDMAKKYSIPLKVSIKPKDEILFEKVKNLEECFEDEGTLFNSGEFDGLTSSEARPKITEWLSRKGLATKTIKYKLRDWVFSRQRYWGEPIPIVHCLACGYVPVPEKELPVTLPRVKKYEPTDTGESPLALMDKWVRTKCPTCKGPAYRETDTMPNWAGSSWYFLRYTDPKNKKEFASKSALKYWMKDGVNWYNGGMEHTTLHLLYSRFWHKFLYDLKLVPTLEPYHKRTSHGMILAEDGSKMSKSVGNVVNPDEIIKLYGSDTLRLYEMFMGPFDQSVAWSTQSIIGPRRFIERLWRAQEKVSLKTKTDPELQALLHKTIKKIGDDIETTGFNTAVSSCMIFLNEIEKVGHIHVKDFKIFLQLLAPFIPHVADEMWRNTGEKKSIHTSMWPTYDPKKLINERIKIVVQVNGKVRAELVLTKDLSEEDIKAEAMKDIAIIPWIENKKIQRIIYVPGRLVNIVVT